MIRLTVALLGMAASAVVLIVVPAPREAVLPDGIAKFHDGAVTCYYAKWDAGPQAGTAFAISCVSAPPVLIDYGKKVER